MINDLKNVRRHSRRSHDCAISEMESLVFAILSPASSIRQRVRYSICDTPTVSLNLSAKIDRDMPAGCPNSSTVQSCPGSSWMDVIAAPT